MGCWLAKQWCGVKLYLNKVGLFVLLIRSNGDNYKLMLRGLLG